MGYSQGESQAGSGFSEVRLGPVPDPVSFLLTKNNRHVVYAMDKGGKTQVLFDGKAAGPEFEGVFVESSTAIDRDGTRFGYAFGKEDKDSECTTCGPQGKWHVVIDGRLGPEYDKTNGIVFSPDGKTAAYGAIDKKRDKAKPGDKDHWVLVVNGKETPLPYEAISRESPAFTPDGRHLVYIAKKGEKAVVVVDGREEAAFDKIANSIPVFSAEGAHMAYVGKNFEGSDGGMDKVIRDGKAGTPFDHIPAQSVIFSPDGQRLAYGGQRGGVIPPDPGKWAVVTDGKAGPEYDQVDTIAFSPDSKHIAYKARQGDKWLLVIDGKPTPEYENLAEGFPVFSPDGRRLAYGCKEDGKWKVFVDVLDPEANPKDGPSGAIGEEYDRGVGLITFSPDGRRLAYAGRNGDRKVVVVDGKRGPEHDFVDRIVFSPDGTRVAYEAGKYEPHKDDQWFMVVDGQAKPIYAGLMRGSLLFSADGKHVAYTISKGLGQMAVIDDRIGPEYKSFCQLWASAENGFEAIVVGDNLYRMVWKPREAKSSQPPAP